MTAWIESAVQSMGYLGVVLFMFLENVFPPIPSEVIMPLAGFTATRGELTLWGVILAGMAGSVAGAIPLYLLGRWIGTERLERWAADHGHWILLSPREVARSKRWFDRHAKSAVFVGRLVPGVRSLISIPAGMHRMPLGRFLVLTAAGTLLWAALLAAAGHLLGERYEVVARYVGPAAWIVLGGLVLWYAVYAWRGHRKKHADA